ncbi:DUF6046 domain-containing protein [Tenacibaculum sp. SSH1-16]|uniref:DUF6046 domain-containing protein n=1 Tax=Tenacibaculum sp. SSH1-16 TaxID=3136667 RepID=UPI0032C48E54
MSESIVINLAERYQAAFGINAKGVSVNFAVVNAQENEELELSNSDYSVEYYGDYNKDSEKVIFQFDAQKLVFTEMLSGDDSNIYAPPLIMSFSREKQLIETEPSGSDDFVVERWSTSPWIIDIRGVLIDVKNRQYPKDKINQLTRLFQFNDVVKVVGEQFYAHEIDSIYFTSVNVTPVEGFQDTIQINLSAKSKKGVFYTLLKPL